MVSPVQFSNQKISFRANEDLISAPGAFEQQAQAIPETPDDEVVLSNKPNNTEKKGSVGQTIAKVLGSAVVVAGALFGLYKWKGVHGDWLNKDAQTTGAKIKNALVKPGEWIDDAFKSIGEKLGLGKKKPATGTSGAEVGAEAGARADAGAEAGAGKSEDIITPVT